MSLVRFGSIFIVAALFIVALVFFRGPISGSFIYLKSLLGMATQTDSQIEISKLETENLNLKSKLFEFESQNGSSRDDRYKFLEAGVYSYFPMNNKGLLVINKGSIDGIKISMPVVTAGGFVLGKIKAVKRTQSEVLTVFDPTWKSSVFLGARNSEAVIFGGTSPMLDLISKNSNTSSGIAVINGSPDLPYGLPFGFVGEISLSRAGTFNKASLHLPYDSEVLDKVSVITNFP